MRPLFPDTCTTHLTKEGGLTLKSLHPQNLVGLEYATGLQSSTSTAEQYGYSPETMTTMPRTRLHIH